MRPRRFGGAEGFGFSLDLTPVVRRLLVANFGVWLVQLAFGLSGSSLFEDWFALDPARALPWRPWQLFTYMFLHSAPGPGHGGNPMHLLINMLMLAVVGGPVERRLGGRRFWRYYALCGLAGGVLTLVPPFRATTVGASGAVLGVLVAFGLFYPDTPMFIFFFFPPVPAKLVVLFLALLNLMSAATAGRDGIAYMAHVGGMAAGYCMLRGVPFTGRVQRWWRRQGAASRARRREARRDQLDAILDKMHQQGKESLSQEEWKILLEASRRRHEE